MRPVLLLPAFGLLLLTFGQKVTAQVPCGGIGSCGGQYCPPPELPSIAMPAWYQWNCCVPDTTQTGSGSHCRLSWRRWYLVQVPYTGIWMLMLGEATWVDGPPTEVCY